jgi:RNA polymerase sigma factor (sigma-70 family)
VSVPLHRTRGSRNAATCATLGSVKLFRRSTLVTPGAPLSDGDLRTLLIQDPDRGWRAFIDQYTPAMLAFIERAGIHDKDEAMELYVLVCERLADDDCARIRRFDPSKGAIASWLLVMVRNVMVDWVRSRAGRRRLFKSIQALPRLEQRVFELFYWENAMPGEMVDRLAGEEFGSPSLAAVLESLERVQQALTERQRGELLAMTSRGAAAVSLDAPTDDETQAIDPADPAADVEGHAEAREADDLIGRALAGLAPEEAAIVRLKYEEGLSLKQIKSALHLETLTEQRVREILARLKARLAALGLTGDSEVKGLAFLDGGQS